MASHKEYKYILIIFVIYHLLINGNVIAQTITTSFTTTGASTWTAPCGVTSVTVECWGAGGGGGSAKDSLGAVGGGGSGGAYTKGTFTVVPGTTYNLYVGNGGVAGGVGNNGVAGESSWFINTTTALAVGGGGGSRAYQTTTVANGATAVTTGNVNIGAGILNFYGGAGAKGTRSSISGGGGGSAGSGSVGNGAVGGTGGTAVTGGAAGANGVSTNSCPQAPSPGGGGCGGYVITALTGTIGGKGGNGKIVLTYTKSTTYCVPSFSNPTPITDVKFAGISNVTSAATGGNSWETYYCPTAAVNKGLTYPIYLKGNTGGNFTDSFRVYFDWNRNNSFADAGESYLIGGISNDGGVGFDATVLSSNILVPATASSGTTTMRVIKLRGADPVDPCYSGNSYGEAEDYLVAVSDPAACVTPSAQPTNLLLTASSESAITVSFTASAGANNYLVIRTTTSTQPSNPVNGVQYNPGDSALGGVIIGYSNTTTLISGGLLPSTSYWYWIFASNSNCNGQPIYLTTSPLTSSVSTNSCGATAANNLIIAGGASATYYWSSAAWSAGHIPTACETVIIRYDNSRNNGVNEKATVVMDMDATVNSLQVIGNYGSLTNGQVEKKELKLLTNGHNLTVINSTIIGCNGGVANVNSSGGGNAVYAHTSSLIATDSANKKSNLNFLGPVSVCRNSGTIDNQISGLGGAQGSSANFYFYGDLTFNQFAQNFYPGNYFFAKVSGYPSVNNNMIYFPLLFRNVSVGANASSATTLTSSGTYALRTGIYGGNLTIQSGSKLRLYDGSGFSQFKNPSTPEGSLILNSGAIILVGGVSGATIINGNAFSGFSGSNFPANFATYNLNAGSTVDYCGVNGTSQTIASPVTYGNLTLSNGSGAVGNADKILVSNLSGIQGDLNISQYSTFNLSTYTANRTTSGGTLTLGVNSNMILSGFTGGPGGQNNFPNNFSSFTLNASSNVTYNGAGIQKIYGVPNYGNLTLDGTGTKISPAVSLGLKGNFYLRGNAVFDHANSIVNFLTALNGQSIYNYTNGTLVFYNLKNNNTNVAGLNVMSNISIVNSLSHNGNNILNINGAAITLLSDSTKTACVSAVPATSFINYLNGGKFIVERCLYNNSTTGGRKWRLLSVPAQGNNQTIFSSWQENGVDTSSIYGCRTYDPRTDWAVRGFDGFGYNSSVKKFYQGNFVPVDNTNTVDNLNASRGYMLFAAGPRTFNSYPGYQPTKLRTSGSIKIGDQPAVTVSANQFEIVSNPYPCRLNLKLLNFTGLDSAFYLWDPSLTGPYGLGGWNTIFKQGNDYVNLLSSSIYGSSNSVNNWIESGAAFLVKAGSSGGSLTFQESAKDTGSLVSMRTLESAYPQIQIELQRQLVNSTESVTLDGALLQFDASFQNMISSNDIKKLSIQSSETVAIISQDSILSIERKSLPQENDTIQLQVRNLKTQAYQLSLKLSQFANHSYQPFLYDRYLNQLQVIDPLSNMVYPFQVTNQTASYSADRFAIVFKSLQALPMKITSFTVRRYDNRNVLYWTVDHPEAGFFQLEKSKDGFSFFDLSTPVASNIMSQQQFCSRVDSILDPKVSVFYRVKLVNSNGLVNYSEIIRVTPDEILNSSRIIEKYFIDNKNISLFFSKSQFGCKVNFELINVAGQILSRKKMVPDENENQMDFPLPIVKGNYYLRFSNSNGVEQTIQVFVVD